MGARADAFDFFSTAKRKIGPIHSYDFREFSESLVQNIDEICFCRDVRSLVPYFVSPSFERIFGRPRATAYEEPSSWIEAIHPEDREQAIKNHHKADSISTLQMEYRIVRPTGEVRWLSVRIFPAVCDDSSWAVIGIASA